jgi:Flp pilus assembly pilin Flp
MLYKVYLKNYVRGTVSFLGALPERRKQSRGIPLVTSAFRWARLIFGGLVKDARALFIVPSDNGKDKGASSVEYAILVAVIAAVAIFGIQTVGPVVKSWLESFLNQWPSIP